MGLKLWIYLILILIKLFAQIAPHHPQNPIAYSAKQNSDRLEISTYRNSDRNTLLP
jgi:hypothetical protein